MLLRSNDTVDELLILLSLVKPTEVEGAKILAFLEHRQMDWTLLYDLAKANQTTPLVWINLIRIKAQNLCPAFIAEKFSTDSMAIHEINKNRINTGLKLLQAFSDAGVKVALLKGIFFAEKIYSNSSYKKMNDIDILIPKEQADSALKVFRGLHYFCAGELLGNSPENQKDVSHHLPPFFSRDLHCMIGTHWGFINPLVGINPNYDIIWSRAKEFNYHGVNCYHLSPEDNLLHLCIHLSLYKSGIKEVADIYNLILSTEIDWSYFIDHAKSANALSSVVLALTVSQTLYSIPKVSEILLQLKNDQDLSPSVDTLKKCQSRSFLLRTRTTYVTLLDKEFIQFKSTQVFGEKLHSFIKIWSLLLFPPTDEAQKLTFRSHSNYITAIYAPIKIVTHLCHELGTKIFFLLHVYLIYSLAKSLFRNLFNVKKKGFSEYAHDLGLSTEDIALLKMRLE